MKPIVWSFGGGVQSVAILVLVAEGKLPKPECVVMSDTGREFVPHLGVHRTVHKAVAEYYRPDVGNRGA